MHWRRRLVLAQQCAIDRIGQVRAMGRHLLSTVSYRAAARFIEWNGEASPMCPPPHDLGERAGIQVGSNSADLAMPRYHDRQRRSWSLILATSRSGVLELDLVGGMITG
jgi:hypothetical protein